jgi:conjugal transfer pilus assembly protein TraK
MMAHYAWGAVGAGTALIARPYSIAGRPLGVLLVGLGLFAVSSPAFADQSVLAKDNGQVDCIASAKDLTRISLNGDQFASVSKISTGVPTEDFQIVNEPVRGDIYLSVPDGFSKPQLSFFGTTRKGFVYKFLCKVRGNDAEQIFITNAALDVEKARDWEVRTSPDETAVRLGLAMYAGETIEGFEITHAVLEPVRVGKLQVQQVSEYRGSEIRGTVLRVRNLSKQAVTLDQSMISAGGAVAFIAPVPELAPGQDSAVYLIQSNGGAQ